jgi:hypothetical protein
LIADSSTFHFQINLFFALFEGAFVSKGNLKDLEVLIITFLTFAAKAVTTIPTTNRGS